MDYRRNEGFIRQPSSSRFRDPYESMDRGEASQHRLVRRSVSPQELPVEMGLGQRNGSAERREYDWALDHRRAGRARSRSPQAMVLGDKRKRPHYDNGVGNYSPTPLTELRQRRGELGEPKNLDFENDETEFHAMHGYGYEPSDPRISKEDFNDISFSPGDKHQLLAQDSVPSKGLAEGSYHSPTHLGPSAASVYGVTSGKIPPLPRAMDSQQHYEQGRLHQYQDAVASNRPATHPYKEGEKPMIVSRDVAYHMIPGSNSKGFASSSSDMSRHEFLAYQDDLHLPQTNEFKSSLKLAEPTNVNVYRERPVLDSARDPEGSQRNPTYYVREYSPNNGEHENYFYVKSREVVDDRGYPVDEMHKKVAAPRGQLDYGRTQIIYDNRDMSRASIAHSVVDRNENIDGPGGNPRRGIMYYRHPAVEKHTDSDHLDMRRTPHVTKQVGEYMGSRYTRVEIGRTVPEDHELLHIGAPKDHRISDLGAEYVFEDYVGPQFHEERLMRSPAAKYETEMNRHSVRMPDARDVHRVYKQQERVVKGKYTIQEGASTFNPRKTFVGKSRQFEELNESGEEWINEETGELYTSRTRRYQQPGFRRNERKYEPGDRGDFESDEWFSSQEMPHARKHSVGFHRPYNRHIKGNRRPGYISHHNSQQYDRKDHHLYRQRNQYDKRNQPFRQHNHFDRRNQNNPYHRPQKMWKRNEGNYEDTRADDGNNNSDPSEDWVRPEESAVPEDSGEFKQLVHEAFLKYSRILNASSGVKRRYKEEGKAGSLFCIVCGRSASKEFMDTRRLVTHAFMSHKTGLRADHLGLHKAICVLLGWNTMIPDDTITWLPQILSKELALAQKEDLILWPPVVVIHNISLSDRNPEKWNVVTVDALEAFVRSKGFIRGRIKVVLGKPADQSVMVVKFLGTFTGLGDAEKLHKYFLERDRGRVDLEIATQNNGDISINKEAETVEENILYGYVGISEDLDRVDYNTRNSGLVKSKIDILDLANDPVKKEET